MKIYVISHKYIDAGRYPESYQNLLVGAYNKEHTYDNYYYDDIGDNISRKNPNYCELTGLYSIWKNSSEDIVGIVHYRRFFTTNRFSSSSKYFYNTKLIYKKLKKYDAIVGEKVFSNTENVAKDYGKFHFAKDWNILKNIIKNDFNSYYDDFCKIENGDWFYPYNMIITKRDIFNNYCKWLFSVLNEVEKRTDISRYSTQQARIYGFMSERLLALWLIHNNVNVFEAPVVQTDGRFRYRVRRYIEKILNRRITK